MAAKAQTFFIRGSVTPDDDNTFVQTTIDLGSFVNVSDKAAVILRVHNIEGEWVGGPAATGTTNPNGAPLMDASSAASAVWQLSTQDQTALIALSDRACIAKGMIWASNPIASSQSPSTAYSDSHLPQAYAEGYLVATDNIYLGAVSGGSWAETSDLTFNMQLEVSLEKVTTANAVSLALSQQN